MPNNRKKRFEAATLWVWLNYLQPGGEERFDHGVIPITPSSVVFFNFSGKDQTERLGQFIQTMYMPNYYGWEALSQETQDRLSKYARGSEMETFERLFKMTPFRKNAQRELDMLYARIQTRFAQEEKPFTYYEAFRLVKVAFGRHARHEARYERLKRLAQSGGMATPQIDVVEYAMLEDEIRWIENEVTQFIALLYRKLLTEEAEVKSQ